MTTKNGKGPLTSEELQELRPLTAGDFYWGHKHADKLPDGWDWESTGAPAQREHQGITYMAAESRLKYNACTAGDPYEGDSSS